MKHPAIRTALLAIAGATLVATFARAATITYNDGDLVMGFRATGGTGNTSNVVIDIGQASFFTNLAVGATIDLNTGAGAGAGYNPIGDLDTVLNNTYGASGAWATRSDLLWGVAGAAVNPVGSDAASTLYAGRATSPPGTATTGSGTYVRATASAQSTTAGKVQTFGTDMSFNNRQAEANTNNTTAVEGTGDTGSWTSFMPAGTNSTATTSFGRWSNGAPPFEASNAGGLTLVGLDLFRAAPSTTGGNSTEIGFFAIDGSGTVTFTAVPEPSTYRMMALGGLGLIGLLILRRRRAARA